MRAVHRVLAGMLVLGLVACGDGGVTAPNAADPSTATTASAPSGTTTTSVGPSDGAPAPTTSSTEVSAADSVVRAYFLRQEKVGPVAREATTEGVAAEAIQGLLAGPTSTERELGFSSAIPSGTELLGVVIDDGVATVDLSAAFTSGGGSLSMMSRVAQVVFTLTQFPTVDAVELEVEGVPVSTLGGEGLLVDEPQTRADWEDLAPAILVESPLPLTAVTSPLRITGTANVFEAQFRVNVTDGDGLIVYDERVAASSGTGTRGTFDITAAFDVPREGMGSVIVLQESPKDGSPVDVVEVPVDLSRPKR